MTVHLPEDLERYLRDAVMSGQFASEDEAISAAVRLLQTTRPRATASVPPDQNGPIAASVPAWQRVLDIMSDVPDEVFDRIPADSSEQLDHYIYGSPKRPTA
jgi:Arc/MetJ-type ribon-helix-helix transcriptional regulator